MVTEPKTIHVTTGSELDQVVEAAKETPVILEKDGVRYRLSRENSGPWANYNPEAVIAAVRVAAGSLGPDGGEKLKACVYQAREEGSRLAGTSSAPID